MDEAALIRKLMTIFLGELADHVGSLSDNLLALEKGGEAAEREEIYKSLFRSAHSLKSAARSVDLPAIETACHRLETLFGAVREGHRTLDPVLCQILFDVVDAIGDAGRRITAGQTMSCSALDQQIAVLDGLITGHPPPPPEALQPEPPRPEPPRPEPPRPEPPRPEPLPAPVQETAVTEPRAALIGPLTPETLVKVPAERLERLMTLSGELLIARRRLRLREEALAELLDGHGTQGGLQGGRRAGRGLSAEALHGQVRQWLQDARRDRRRVDDAADPLERALREVRMLPFADACTGLERTVRDVARTCGKEAVLVNTGADVALDRLLVDGLRDILLHLVRNAVDHGLEPAAERCRLGKPAAGTVTVAASLHGNRVQIQVADDGRGLVRESIIARARQLGLNGGGDGGSSGEAAEVSELIFAPGFSTAATITQLSGRGVGLDAVRHLVDGLLGDITVASTPGRGCTFTLTFPQSLILRRCLLLRSAGQVFALDCIAVEGLARVHPADVRCPAGSEMVMMDGIPLPLYRLADLLGLTVAADDPGVDGPAHGDSHGPRTVGYKVVIVSTGGSRCGLVVDQWLAEQDIVVKPLGPRLRRVRHVQSASVLPDGSIALLLNTAELVRSGSDRTAAPSLATMAPATGPRRKRLIVADDSVTIRALEASILEAEGYEVIAVTDGLEAWNQLQIRGADLVVSDVEMPRMDGFTLTRTIRTSSRFAATPVVLVTALANDEHKLSGLEAGANAYIVKSAFDQQALLDTISRLL